MLLPLIVGLIYKDYASSLAFAYTLMPSSILGLLLIKFTSVKSNKLKMRDGAFIVSVSWILCGLIGAIPFVITGSIPNFIGGPAPGARGVRRGPGPPVRRGRSRIKSLLRSHTGSSAELKLRAR